PLTTPTPEATLRSAAVSTSASVRRLPASSRALRSSGSSRRHPPSRSTPTTRRCVGPASSSAVTQASRSSSPADPAPGAVCVPPRRAAVAWTSQSGPRRQATTALSESSTNSDRGRLSRLDSDSRSGRVSVRPVPPGRLLYAVHERDPGPHEGQEVRPVEPPPPHLRHVEELVGHQEPLRPRPCALGDSLPQPHGRERRLDRQAPGLGRRYASADVPRWRAKMRAIHATPGWPAQRASHVWRAA